MCLNVCAHMPAYQHNTWACSTYLYVISEHLVYRLFCKHNEKYWSKFFQLGYLFFPYCILQTFLSTTRTLQRSLFLTHHAGWSINQIKLNYFFCYLVIENFSWDHRYELIDVRTHLMFQGYWTCPNLWLNAIGNTQ